MVTKEPMTEIGEYIRSLPWRHRLRIWLAGFKVRRLIRNGWRPTMRDLCCECLHPVEPNDDALVCIQCGGRNYRLPQDVKHE